MITEKELNNRLLGFEESQMKSNFFDEKDFDKFLNDLISFIGENGHDFSESISHRVKHLTNILNDRINSNRKFYQKA